MLQALSALSEGSTDSHFSEIQPPSTHGSLCVPSDRTPEPFFQTVSSSTTNTTTNPSAQLKSSESMEDEKHEEEASLPCDYSLFDSHFSPEHGISEVKSQKQPTTDRKSLHTKELHTTTQMEEEPFYFVYSPKTDHLNKSLILFSTGFEECPYLTQQNCLSEEVFHLQDKTVTTPGPPFLCRQDSVEILHANDISTMQTKKDIFGSDLARSASKSDMRLPLEKVYLDTEIDSQVFTPGCVIRERQSNDLCKDSEKKSNGIENDHSSEELNETEVEAKVSDLIEIESLYDVFETSVDASEVDPGDVESFFDELKSIGQVYWAEPIHISDPSPLSGSFEDLNTLQQNSELLKHPVLDDFASMDKSMFQLSRPTDRSFIDSVKHSSSASPEKSALSITTPDHKQASRSVSVQMKSSPSSHIVQRKDIPYTDNSKHSILPRRFKLDTSTPYRAVQSWTDLHIQQNTTTYHTSKVSTSAGENLNRPGESCLPPSSFPEWQSDDCLHRTSRAEQKTLSASLDTGLWADEAYEEVDRMGNEGQMVWENRQTCCCCDHQCNSCKRNNQQVSHSFPNLSSNFPRHGQVDTGGTSLFGLF